MSTLYLIRGVCGSGKSTFAQTLKQNGVVQYVFEADQYFCQSGEYKFDPTKLHSAHKDCQDSVKLALSLDSSVCVSNTSTTEREVETYAKIAEEYGAKFVSIIVENRHDGTNVHNVPEEKVQQMRNRFSVKL